MRRPGALLLLATAAALAARAPAATADEVKLPSTRAVLDVPRGFTPVLGASSRGLVAAYRGDGGVVLAVTRAQIANTDAYRKAARDAYVEQIERGVAGRVKGYRRVARRFGEQHGTPALDLEAKRDDGATIIVRVLLFWTYALALAIEVPPDKDPKVAREIAAKFGPPAPAAPKP